MTEKQLVIFPVLVIAFTLFNLLWQVVTEKDWGKALEWSLFQGLSLTVYVVLCTFMNAAQIKNQQKIEVVTIQQTSNAPNSPNISGVAGDIVLEGDGPSVVACQDGAAATVQNAVLVPVKAQLPGGQSAYIIIVFDRKVSKTTQNLPGMDSGGAYKAYFFDTSSLRIDGKESKPADLRMVFGEATAKIHMLLPNGKCNGWKGLGTFTSIEVTTKK